MKGRRSSSSRRRGKKATATARKGGPPRRAKGGAPVTRSAAKRKRAEEVQAVVGPIVALNHIMFDPIDVALPLLEQLSYEDLLKLVAMKMWVDRKNLWPRPPGTTPPPPPRFRSRMAELTGKRPWRPGRALTSGEMQWLSKVGVRTELHFEKRPMETSIPFLDASEVWMVNGKDRAIVGPNGEFWMAGPRVVRPPQQERVVAAARLLVPVFVPIPSAAYHIDDEDYEIDGVRYAIPHRMLHRENAPAVRDSAGYELWLRHGIPHRTNGPAVVRPDRELWFFRGTHVPGGQSDLDKLAAAAAPDPVFDESIAPQLPDGILEPALPASAAALPSYRSDLTLSASDMFGSSSSEVLDRLMDVDLPVKSLEFSAAVDEHGGETPRLLQFMPRKPLNEAVLEDLVEFMLAPVTEAYFAELRAAGSRPGGAQGRRFRDASFESTAIWGFPRSTLVDGDHIVQVKVNEVGQARIRVDHDDDAAAAAGADVEWDVVDESGRPWRRI